MRRPFHLQHATALILGLLAWATPQVVEAAAVEADEPHARTLYLVRHGAYRADSSVDPNVGPGISALGVAQAQLVSSRLAGMRVRFDSITSSAMTRASETAAVIRETLVDVPMAQSPSLNECRPPSIRTPERASAEEAACARRLEAVYAERFKPAAGAASHELIVAHGNVIRYLVTRALGVDTRAWLGLSVAHASLTVVRVLADGSMIVVSVGDVGHIPQSLQSWGGYADPEFCAGSQFRTP